MRARPGCSARPPAVASSQQKNMFVVRAAAASFGSLLGRGTSLRRPSLASFSALSDARPPGLLAVKSLLPAALRHPTHPRRSATPLRGTCRMPRPLIYQRPRRLAHRRWFQHQSLCLQAFLFRCLDHPRFHSIHKWYRLPLYQPPRGELAPATHSELRNNVPSVRLTASRFAAALSFLTGTVSAHCPQFLSQMICRFKVDSAYYLNGSLSLRLPGVALLKGLDARVARLARRLRLQGRLTHAPGRRYKGRGPRPVPRG